MKKLFVFTVILLLCISLLIGCGTATTPATQPATGAPATTAKPTPAAPAAQYGGTLRYITIGGLSPPGTPWEGTGGRIGGAVYEALVKVDDSLRIQPWLATSWDIPADGSSITFHLRQGVKFHDGTEFNAEAVKYSLQNWGPTGAAAFAQIASIDVIDNFTVRLNLKKFDALLMYRLGQSYGYICSPTAAKVPATAETRSQLHMIGTGPFKYVSHKVNTSITVAKFDGYWQKGKPYLDGAIGTNIGDTTTRMMSFEAGEGDFVEPLDPKDIDRLAGKGYTVLPATLGFIYALFLDGANADSPFANKKVREAVEYAIDKKSLSKLVSLDKWPPASQAQISTDPFFVSEVTKRDYNPEKAKQLLKEAGYANGFKCTWTVESTAITTIDEAIISYLKAVGIEATMDKADATRFTELTNKGWKGIVRSGRPMMTDLVSMVSRFGVGTSWVSQYRPPGIADKWTAVGLQVDENKRIAQVKEIIKIMAEEAIITPLMESLSRCAFTNKVHDIGYLYRGTSLGWDQFNTWLSK